MTQPDSIATRTLALIRRRFFALLGATTWPYALSAIVHLSIGAVIHAHPSPGGQQDLTSLVDSMGAATKIGWILAFVVSIFLPAGLATAGASMIVWSELSGDARIDMPSPGTRFVRVLLRVVILSLCTGIMSGIASFFFVIPGFFVSLFLAFAIPAVVIKDDSAFAALRRSVKLAAKEIGPLVLVYGLGAIMIGTAMFVFIVVFSSAGDLPWWVNGLALWFFLGVSTSLFLMIRTSVTVLVFRDALEKQATIATS